MKVLMVGHAGHTNKGFTLVELMVSLSIGLVIFAGVMSVFVGMRTTTAETSSYGELQENGRFAISVLTDDILNQDLWGDYTGTFDLSTISHTLVAPGNDCTGAGVNNASFPVAVGHFRTIWGDIVDSSNPMGCFNDAKIGSDVIQVKRVLASELVKLEDGDLVPITSAPAGNYHLVTNINDGILFSSGAVPAVENSRVWQYQHHVYYVREETQGSNTVPVLMQGRLTNQMSFAPIIDGIEMIHFMYGYDADTDPDAAGYGVVDAYISSSDMTAALWDDAGGTKIIAVKIFVLARNIAADNKYTNNNIYQLGDLTVTFNDNYRRLLFSSTVTLYNARVDLW
ncbi:PilW family protein [Colwellia piezophila]|uniref:PilW family protein n=1 Tax=Colwellia piezophila TaxID=211668 RepID=UPI001FE1D83C|nr:PilW family protein [Colwellia piezophila]